jgi:hypothetical protein
VHTVHVGVLRRFWKHSIWRIGQHLDTYLRVDEIPGIVATTRWECWREGCNSHGDSNLRRVLTPIRARAGCLLTMEQTLENGEPCATTGPGVPGQRIDYRSAKSPMQKSSGMQNLVEVPTSSIKQVSNPVLLVYALGAIARCKLSTKRESRRTGSYNSLRPAYKNAL